MVLKNSHVEVINQSTGMPKLKLTKIPDKTRYYVGDTVIFTITISNPYSKSVSSVILTDNVPIGSSFLTSSLTLDGNSISGVNFLSKGLLIGNMNSGDSHVVTYQMTINSMPSPNPVQNNPAVNYDYVDYSGATQIGIITGKATPFTVASDGNSNVIPLMQLTKTPDKNNYNVGDTVTFTIVVMNKRGRAASNVILTDSVPNAATFITSSLTLDGNSVSGANYLTNGLALGSMVKGTSHTITYQMTINSMPNLNPVKNDPVVNYKYVSYSGVTQKVTLAGKTIPFTVMSGGNGSVAPVMKLTKTPDQNSYNVGDTVTFTIVVMNKGGRVASNIILTDSVPTVATFIPSSLTLDGNSVSGTNYLTNGLALGSIPKGSSRTVTYQMTINSMPNSNPVKNDPVIAYKYVNYSGVTQRVTLTGTTAPFTVMSNGVGSNAPVMQLTKIPDQNNYNVGDTVTFTIGIVNLSGEYAGGVILTDNIPYEATFITSSLTLDGNSIDGSTFISMGLLLGDMDIADSHVVTYQMSIDSVPTTNPVENDPTISYNYIDSNGVNQIGTITGSTAQFTVLYGVNGLGTPTMKLTKTPDQSMYMLGGTVAFTLKISNLSGEDATNIVLTDNIPTGTSFKITTLTLDGLSVSGTNFINNGLAIPDMSVGDSHVVTYQIIINSMPNPNPVENDPVINYDYVDSNGATQIGTLTGVATPFTVVPNGSGNGCCCCCCCPCMCK